MRKRISLLLLFVAALSSQSLAAPSNPRLLALNSITGFVFNTAGRPVADIYVELQNDMGVSISRARTAASGMYAFRGLPDGTYTVKVLPYGSGYRGQERRISLASISPIGRGSASEQVDFYLEENLAERGPLAAPEVLFAQDVPSKARDLYEAGVKDLSNKKDKEAFEKLKSALELFPTYYLALDRLGTEYVVRGYYRPAYVLLQKALEVNTRSFSSRLGFGIAQLNVGQVDEAIETLRRATETYGESALAYLWMGIAQHKKGILVEAQNSLLRANRMTRGKSPDVHWHLGRLYNDQGKFAEAANELELVLKLSPDHKSADEIRKTVSTLREKAAAQKKPGV